MKIPKTTPCHHLRFATKLRTSCCPPMRLVSDDPLKHVGEKTFGKAITCWERLHAISLFNVLWFFSFYVFEAQMTVYHKAPLSSFLKAACLLCVNCTGNQSTHGMLVKDLIILFTFNSIRLVLVYFFDRHFYADLYF